MSGEIARAFGLELALPADDAEPEEKLRMAELIGEAIGARRPQPVDEPGWVELPGRAVVPAPAGERRAAVDRLLAWAKERGAWWSGVQLVVDAGGDVSARAERSIAAGEPILRLPRRLMIADDQLGAAMGNVARGRDALAAWLPLEARDPSSRWRTYLDALPAQLPGLPMFHAAADLDPIAGTAAYEVAAEHNRGVVDGYHALPDRLRARVSLADFAWGCAIVMSRAFHAPGTIEPTIALLPVVDLFDHGLGDTTWSYDPRDGNLVIEAERALAPGEAIHFPYGERSNSYLFAHCGFTLPDNPIDEADLLFERGEDPVTGVAAHLLWRLALTGPARVRVRGVADHQLEHARSLARLWSASRAERARLAGTGFAPDAGVPWIGAENETAATIAITGAARRSRARLRQHVPPASDDAWAQSCARVRESERRLLDRIAALAADVR